MEPRSIYPKHFLAEPVARRPSGFILMPFHSDFDSVHEAIRRGITKAGLDPVRVVLAE